MSMSSDEKGHVMVVGSTGGGKTTHCYDVLKKRLSRKQRTDWLRLRNVVQKNREGKHFDNRYPETPGDGHHDK